ncbi:unnamed protein product [Gulo gulo]|uniref:Uncharacterized protein n=1 Tax=Gulo gulo TaxID=48420 RepID=A0A9X9MAB1_GULGU|nr:unnamed protein product [Gulo gulo]
MLWLGNSKQRSSLQKSPGPGRKRRQELPGNLEARPRFQWAPLRERDRNPPSDVHTTLALRGAKHTPQKAKPGPLASKEPASPFRTALKS